MTFSSYFSRIKRRIITTKFLSDTLIPNACFSTGLARRFIAVRTTPKLKLMILEIEAKIHTAFSCFRFPKNEDDL